MAASAFTLPAMVAHPRNAFIAYSASAHVGAPTLTSVSSKLLPPQRGHFAFRPQATSSMGEWNRIQAARMLLKFFGCTGLLVAALGRAVRAQQSKSRCYRMRCFAIASVQLSTPAVTPCAEAGSSSPGSISVPLVPPAMASSLETMAPAIGHVAAQLVATGMVAKRRRCPRAARNMSRHRRKSSPAETTRGTTRSTRRRIGARLHAHTETHAVAAIATSYDPSRVRTQIQVGLTVWNRFCTSSGRESKTPSAQKVSMTATRTGMKVQLCRRLL